jgi:hypothetical protein
MASMSSRRIRVATGLTFLIALAAFGTPTLIGIPIENQPRDVYPASKGWTRLITRTDSWMKDKQLSGILLAVNHGETGVLRSYGWVPNFRDLCQAIS